MKGERTTRILENRAKEELLDIYWNIADGVWDRRIGRKPDIFDRIPLYRSFFHRICKYDFLEPYISYIKDNTTEKERRKYLMVNIQKTATEQEFEKWWSSMEK